MPLLIQTTYWVCMIQINLNLVTLNTEQLIPYSRISLVDTISSLQDSEGGGIPISEVHELLIKIHDILDDAVSK